jgi:hypothetical protein
MTHRLDVARLASVARELANAPESWWPKVQWAGGPRWYRPLLEESGFEAWLVGWPPGEGIELHHHGSSSGHALSIHAYSPRLTSMTFHENRPHRGLVPVRRQESRPDLVLA